MSSRYVRSLFLVAGGHSVIELCSQFLPIMYPVVIETMGLNYTQVGALALIASVGTSLAQPLFGHLCDLWDPRWLSALGVVWIGLIMGLVGLSNSYGLLALMIGLGVLGSAAFHPPGAMIASSCGGERRGTAVSVFSVGGSVGSALSPLLVTAGIGWLGMRGTVVLVPVALLYSLLLFWLLGQTERIAHSESAACQDSENGDSLLRLALVVLTVMCLSWFQGSFRTYLPIWVNGQRDSLAAGGSMMFVMMASMGVGSLVGGALSDRLGRWQLLAVSLGLVGPVQWLFIGSVGPVQWVLIGVMGVLLGATFPVSIVLAQETWTRGVGIASGLVMGIGWLPGGLGAWVTGRVADKLSLEVALRALVIPALLGLICVLTFAGTRRKSMDKRDRVVPV
jgi:FSR family fosmidomycin resistance protein-like MFS transporter